MVCAPEFTQKFVHLQCKNCTDINIVVPVNFTLAQLHIVLVETLHLPVELDESYHFTTTRPSFGLISPTIKYYPDPSPYHHDGWIRQQQTGVFLEHPHPHAPFDPTASSQCCEIRDSSLWPLSLVLDMNEMTKLTFNLDDNESIELIPTYTEMISNDDNPYLVMGRQCTTCSHSQCSNATPCHLTPCCANCQFASKLPLPFLQDRSIDPMAVSSELNNILVSQLDVIARAIQMEYKRHSSSPQSSCHWMEETGESCVYCTENYL
jgi:hypothetical protein